MGTGLAEGFALGVGEPLLVGPGIGVEPGLGGGGIGDAESVPHAGAGGEDVFGRSDDAEELGEFGDEVAVGGEGAVGLAGEVVLALAVASREVVG